MTEEQIQEEDLAKRVLASREVDLTDPDALEMKRQEKQLLKEVKTSFGKLMPEIMTARTAERQILNQAAADGCPIASSHDALSNLIAETRTGVRELARLTKVNRKVMLGMLEGRVEMPGEVRSQILALMKKKLPHLFSREALSLTH